MSESEEERIFFKAVEVMENSRDDEWMKAIYAAIRETAKVCCARNHYCLTRFIIEGWESEEAVRESARWYERTFPKAFKEES